MIPGRSAEQIEKCYSNIRTRAIEKDRNNALELKKTGGGEPDIKKLEDYEEEILMFIKKAEPLPNIFMDESLNESPSIISAHTQEPTPKRAKQPPNQTLVGLSEVAISNVLKSNVLATQGLAEAHRLPEDEDLKKELLEFYRGEVRSSLTLLKEFD